MTIAPSFISKPWPLVNVRSASRASCLSTGARNVSLASKTVTLEPKRFQTLPNSKPITPAPITPNFLGTSLIFKAPALSTISSLSTSATGIEIGSEPTARIILSAE